MSEGKNDPICNAHSFHTKVPHKAIMRYILHFTEPGDVVFDGFCGTGMTGLAAQLCGDKSAAEPLETLLAGFLRRRKKVFCKVTVLAPSPTSSSGLRKRGCNQYALIASVAGRVLELPVVEGAFGFKRRIYPQHTQFNYRKRLENVRDAYLVNEPLRLQLHNVLIFDDITTSGATLEALQLAMNTAVLLAPLPLWP